MLTDEQRDVVERIRQRRIVIVVEREQRKKRNYVCGTCGETGHNAATCGRPEAHKSNRGAGGRSGDAARWLKENGGTFRDAAARFGISRQAVEQGWARLYPTEQAPSVAASIVRADRILELARSGVVAQQIADDERVNIATVHNVCRRAGVVPDGPAVLKDRDFNRAITMVLEGRPCPEAAAVCNVSLFHLYERMKKLDIARTHKGAGVHTGRTQRAVARLKAGEFATVAAAARAELVSASCVYAALAKSRRP